MVMFDAVQSIAILTEFKSECNTIIWSQRKAVSRDGQQRYCDHVDSSTWCNQRSTTSRGGFVVNHNP